MFQSILQLIAPMKWSLAAWGVFTALGLLSMGLLGFALYFLAWPVLGPVYGNANRWTGDWVWPVMIGAGMLWPLSFLAAGGVQLYLESIGWGRLPAVAAYAAILWLGAVLVWWLLLATRHTL